jgi:hypothetical protein
MAKTDWNYTDLVFVSQVGPTLYIGPKSLTMPATGGTIIFASNVFLA